MAFEEQEASVMEWSNYTMLRNGIREHIRHGKFSASDWCVYSTLHLWVEWATGIYFGNAASIAPLWNGELKERTVRDCMQRLRERTFINYRQGDGKRGSFNILINKYEPTVGAMRGWRLNAFASADLDNPVYEYVGRSPFSERYGERVGERYGEQYGQCQANGTVSATLQDIQDWYKTGEDRLDYQNSQTTTASSSRSVRRRYVAAPAGLTNEDVSRIQSGVQTSPVQSSISTPVLVQSDTGPEHQQQETIQEKMTRLDTKHGAVPDGLPHTVSSPQAIATTVAPSSPISEVSATAKPKTSTPVLSDIRNWAEERFGISGQRLRNCIIYQLDYSKNDWYRTKAEITVSKMNSERFVTKLNSDTPANWTPQKQKAMDASKPVLGSDGKPLPEYRKPQYSIAARIKTNRFLDAEPPSKSSGWKS